MFKRFEENARAKILSEKTLPDKEHILYVVPAVYTRWAGTTHLRIDIRIELFSSTYMWNHQNGFQFEYQTTQSEHIIMCCLPGHYGTHR